MASPQEVFSNFLQATAEDIREAMSSYKKGAFRKKINDTVTAVEMFDLLIATPLTTPTEKNVFRLGRCLAFPFATSPSLEDVQKRIKLYLSAVIGAFAGDSANFKAPPFYCYVDDGTVGFSVTLNDEGNLFYIEGENMQAYSILELLEDIPSFSGSARSQESTPLKKEEPATKTENLNFVSKPTIVHPAVMLTFPDITNPPPDEVDNYPLVMDWIRNQLFQHIKLFKGGAFKYRIKDTMALSEVFKILIGSPLTTPTEKNIFRHGLEWIEYIVARFGGLSKLSHFHSMVYSGVLLDKVFCVFRDDTDATLSKEKGSSEPTVQLWSLRHVDSGVDNRILVGYDWNFIRTPFFELETPNGYNLQQVKLTAEGADQYSQFGKFCSLKYENGILDMETLGELLVKQGLKIGDVNTDEDALSKIVKSKLAENPTRQRSHTGEVSIQEIVEMGQDLHRMLGRAPTGDGLILDLIGATLLEICDKQMTVKERKSRKTA